ncbi:MAG: hypothetical protein QGG36_10525 [Pirellulaceae bacterium]|jgi:hypothetical protein|nr:hypothetical protein [Pirellulaceae bacterium]MDP7016226.1 hypothetical protein [Pirellulaceae bacterium]
MELKELTISDGSIEAIRSSLNEFIVTFRDWQEQQWEISFENFIGVENFNVEGEELDGVVEETASDFIVRSRILAKEPDAPMKCYTFRSPWNDEPLLRIVATGCEVRSLA